MSDNILDDAALGAMLQKAAKTFSPPKDVKEAVRSRVMAEVARRNVRRTTPRALLFLLFGSSRWRKLGLALAALVALSVALAIMLSLGREDALAARIEQAARSMRTSVQSFHVTMRMTTAEGVKTYNTWYKRPNLYREELPNTDKVIVDDGTRNVLFDPSTRVATEVKASEEWDKKLPSMLKLDALQDLAKKGLLRLERTSTEELDGQQCERYDFTMPWADGPMKGSLMKVSLWFAKSDGLFRRMVRKSGPEFSNLYDAEMTVAYNVDLPHDLFVIPADLRGLATEVVPRPPELVVTVLDAQGRPAPAAMVYYGNFAYFERYITGVDGRVFISLENKKYPNLTWHRDGAGNWFWGNAFDYIIAESPDRTSCDVFSLKGLKVFADHGLMQLEPADNKPIRLDEKRVRLTMGLKDQLRYEPSSKRLFLRLQLLPKALVTGRIVDQSGTPFAKGQFFLRAQCLTRPRRYGGYVIYGNAANVPKEKPEPGSVFNLWERNFTRCAKDGTFRVEVPAGHPFKLFIRPINAPVGVRRPTAFPAEEPAEALEPGEVREIGDIVLPMT